MVLLSAIVAEGQHAATITNTEEIKNGELTGKRGNVPKSGLSPFFFLSLSRPFGYVHTVFLL